MHNSTIESLANTGILYHLKGNLYKAFESIRVFMYFIVDLGALENLLCKAHKLVCNETNNKAELYMSLLAKFNCGKRLNLTQK